MSTGLLQMPYTCINSKCMRAGIQVYGTQEVCSDCGESLIPLHMPTNELLKELLTQERVKSRVVKSNTTFTCPSDLTTCPVAKHAHVYIPIKMFNSWVYLADQLDTEWIAYLKGRVVSEEEFTYEITDMYFPKQKAGPTVVEAKEGEILEGTIGAVHSHVDMDVFFSAQDVQHMNHTIELVVNRKSQIVANGRTKLECGRFHRGPASVEFINCDEEVILEDQLRAQLTSETQFVIRPTGK